MRFYLSLSFNDIRIDDSRKNMPVANIGGGCRDGVATFWRQPDGRVSLSGTAIRFALLRAVRANGLPEVDFGYLSSNEAIDSLIQVSRFWATAQESSLLKSMTFEGSLNLWRGGTLAHGVWQSLLRDALPKELRVRHGQGPSCCTLSKVRAYEAGFLTSKVSQVVRGAMHQLISILAADPAQIFEVEHRDFERIAAIVAEDLGFDVRLTRGSKDGGKDLILKCRDELGQIRSIYVEIKHWSSGKKVGPQELRKLLTVIARDQVDGGLLISTSGFTNPAQKLLADLDKSDTVRLVELGEISTYMREYASTSPTVPETLLREIIRRPLL
ncbi:restriction endonuclease [Nonomuraea pusilla]|uniref:Restriction endonuclease n=1 Tax=Nonomuraea pusilla TaxID=46177 RepID=A0A1H8EQM6_9ACTN|nr:restriction endonuclease [Nonomuraea pusilla]SEN21686.1 Restriction endonuclease [Nonomuraea pusilla]